AGLVIDEWTEVVPRGDAAASVAFHFERPSSQPPQAVLIAVPAGNGATWSFEDLVGSVVETLDLARVRCVDGALVRTTGFAQLLPATVFSVSRDDVVIGIDLSLLKTPQAKEVS